jgi:hypothetical protein
MQDNGVYPIVRLWVIFQCAKVEAGTRVRRTNNALSGYSMTRHGLVYGHNVWYEAIRSVARSVDQGKATSSNGYLGG